MSDKLREAAKAALEMLNNDDRDCAFAAGILKDALADPAIKESLTVAEQEPVAWKHPNENRVFWKSTKEVDEYHSFKPTIPLYAAPPRREWVYLTEQDVATIKKNAITMEWAILMADTTAKEKNT